MAALRLIGGLWVYIESLRAVLELPQTLLKLSRCFPELTQGFPEPPLPPELSEATPGEVKGSAAPRLRTKTSLLEHAADATDVTDVTEVVARPVARTPHPTRAGARMTVV